MVGYFYENDADSKEWGETIENMSKWYTEAKEYKEKYKDLSEKYDDLTDKYIKLWEEFIELWEKKDPISHEVQKLDTYYFPWTVTCSNN